MATLSMDRRKLVCQPGRSPKESGRQTVWFPPSHRGRITVLALLLMLAALLLVPAVVFAAAPAVPQGLAATSGVGTGDGTMVLSWNNATDAEGGYQYRYSNEAQGLLEFGGNLLSCEDPCSRSKWLTATDSKTSITFPIPSGTLTVGTTYWFQVRAVNHEGTPDDTSDDTYSGPSNTANALQRALPPAVENLVAIAGNAQVTLTWTHLAAYDIISYLIQREGGTRGGALTPTTEYELNDDHTEATYTVSPLVNGTEYSFQVKGRNFMGDGPDLDVEDFVTATPSGPPAAPRDLTAQVSSSEGTTVKLTWANPEDSNIDEYQYQVRVNTLGSGWEPSWTTVGTSDATTTTYTVEGLISGDPGYEFQVRALDTDRVEGDRAGPHSSVTGTPTTSDTAPEAMTNVRHTVTGVSGGAGGMVTFTWADPGDESIDKYQYRYDGSSSNPDAWDRDWTDVPTQTIDSTQVPNNKDLTVYSRAIPGSSSGVFFELRAVDNHADDSATTDINEGGGPATAIIVERSNTPDSPTTPGAPAGLTASAACNDQSDTDPSNDVWEGVTLTWAAAAADTVIDKYEYQQSVDGGTTYGDWTKIDPSSGDTITHKFTDVTAGTVYVFKLRGVDTDVDPDVEGVPATSNPVTLGTPNAPTELETTDPGGLSGSPIFIDADWKENATGCVTVSGYEYRYRVEADVNWGDWTDTTHGANSGGLLPPPPPDTRPAEGGTKYDFQVRAVNNMGTPDDTSDDIYSGHSNTFRAIAAGAPHVPGAPTAVKAEEGIGYVAISWTAPAVDESKDTTEADRRSAAEFYRYQVTTALTGDDNTPNFTGAAVRIPADDSPTSHTAPGLTADTYYFRVQAANTKGTGDWSAASAGATVTRVLADGGWTYRLDISPSTITPGSATGAEVSLVATWTAHAEDVGEIVALSVKGGGGAGAEVESATPQLVGFGTGSGGVLGTTLRSFTVVEPEACDENIGAGRITCTIAITGGNTKLYVAAGASPGSSYQVSAALTGFSLTAVVNGFDTTGVTVSDAEIKAGSVMVHRPGQAPTSRPSRSIDYAENGTGAVAFLSATSPEGDEVEVSLEGVDAGDFTIDGGMLRFKSSPDYEDPTDRMRADIGNTLDVDETEAATNNEYHVTVRSTDLRPDGAKGAAPTSTLDVVVTVTNVEEAGAATIDWRQPEVTTALTASATDPDDIDGAIEFEWSVPKVSRPTLTNDSHWQAPGAANSSSTYTPVEADEGKYLRVKATYDDMEGDDKVAYVRSEFQVREEVADVANNEPEFDGDAAARDIAEDADVGDAVGNPVVATDANALDGGKLTYTIQTDGDADSFSIDKKTGQIRVAEALDHEAGATSGNGVYEITVVVTDPSGAGDSPAGTDTIPVTITATDVDEAPSVKGKNADTAPVMAHEVAEDANLLDKADLTNSSNEAVRYLSVATDDGDVVSLSLAGDDAAAFELVDIDGTGVGVVYGLTFKGHSQL